MKYVMANAKTLKGTGYFVHRDFTEVVRHKLAHLSAVGVEVHQVTGLRRMPLVLDHLVVNRHGLTWEDSRMNKVDSLQQLLGHNLRDFLTNLAENGPTRQKTGLTETAMEAEDERPSGTMTTPSIPGPPSKLSPSFNSANSHRQALKTQRQYRGRNTGHYPGTPSGL